jgi:hypothetical protein
MTLSTEDREALLIERILVHSIHTDEAGTRVYATGPNPKRTLDFLTGRLGKEVDVVICGDMPREVRLRACAGYEEREPRCLDLRYRLRGGEHMDLIMVAEDERRVVVHGTVCVPVGVMQIGEEDHVHHVYLESPLDGREVFDAVAVDTVPTRETISELPSRAGRAR